MPNDIAAEDALKAGLLLVGDDPLIRDSLSYMLRLDFDIYLAETRREAGEILQQLERPDLD